MRTRVATVIVGVVLAASCVVFAQDQKLQTLIDFNRDIRPILSDTCFTCHGPDATQRMAGLRFDTKDGAFAKPGVIVPGHSSSSKLIKRITAADPEMRMPPLASGRSLTA